QVFAQRYNRAAGRMGHLWGPRLGSRIGAGPPPGAEPGAGGGDSGSGVRPCCTDIGGEPGDTDTGVRPRHGETTIQTAFPPLFPLLPAPVPG
ncbi:MAG: hypothetical protein LBG08_02460, partial [Spirochaetaceae bacterium]|nr:hypothetical protein [Spirochaetaceae bacterium]